MSKIRKAIAAFITAALGAVVAGLAADGVPKDSKEWLSLAGVALGVGVVAAYTVWQVRNVPAVEARR